MGAVLSSLRPRMGGASAAISQRRQGLYEHLFRARGLSARARPALLAPPEAICLDCPHQAAAIGPAPTRRPHFAALFPATFSLRRPASANLQGGAADFRTNIAAQISTNDAQSLSLPRRQRLRAPPPRHTIKKKRYAPLVTGKPEKFSRVTARRHSASRAFAGVGCSYSIYSNGFSQDLPVKAWRIQSALLFMYHPHKHSALRRTAKGAHKRYGQENPLPFPCALLHGAGRRCGRSRRTRTTLPHRPRNLRHLGRRNHCLRARRRHVVRMARQHGGTHRLAL